MTDSTNIAVYKSGSLFAEPDENSSADLIACIGTNGGPYNYDDFAIGYFELGRITGNALANNAMPVDVLFYPLTFAYRQGFELSIKYLIFSLSKFYAGGASPKLDHKLFDNWLILRPLLEQYANDHSYIELKPEQLNAMELLLKDIVEFDPQSMVLRYPENKSGTAYITTPRRIDLKNLNELLHIASNWFEGVIEGTHEDLSEAASEP